MAAAGEAATAPAPAPPAVVVREATRDDMPYIHQMIHELADYEGFPDGPQLTVEELVQDGFETDPPWFFALVAERGGGVERVGYALLNRAYSSWTRRALYLEDLYVAPHARRQGVGGRLLQHVCQMCVALDVQRVDWHVLESNVPALSLYRRLGATDLRAAEGRAALRLHADRIRAVAQGDY